jgi:hypothetical protein
MEMSIYWGYERKANADPSNRHGNQPGNFHRLRGQDMARHTGYCHADEQGRNYHADHSQPTYNQ